MSHKTAAASAVLQSDNPSPQRKNTDDSLRVEREKTDHAVAAKQVKVAQHADAVIDHARENADEVLSVARENADILLGAPATVIEERRIADDVLRDQRANADETLHRERTENARTLRRFLPLERESTDRYLRSERVHSDDALANRDDFLAIVTHDLRDLIGGIMMSTTLLEKNAPPGGDGEKTLAEVRRIERYAARMTRLIGDLADIASIDAGKLAIAPARLDFAAVALEAHETFQAAASAKGISFGIRTDAVPLFAAFDHDRILQVLANLISNALKFTPRGGEIVIRGEAQGDHILLSVADTGCGIPGDSLERVFERFAQASEDDRRGLGLGLYISRSIVEAHGGRIWAENLATGSRVSFTLPR